MLKLLWCVAIIGLGVLASAEAQSRPAAVAESRPLAQLHKKLRKSKGHFHDDYLMAIHIGNEQTAPLLLERLRRDYGAVEPTPPSGGLFGFVCTHGHLVDALRIITNSDQGMFYPRWANWWAENRSLPRDTWIRNGFEAAGMHPVEPADEAFALELIEAVAGKPAWLAENARRLLTRQRKEDRKAWVRMAAGSANPQRRMGALMVLVKVEKTGADEMIQGFASDPDSEVRGFAERVLSERRPDLPR